MPRPHSPQTPQPPLSPQIPHAQTSSTSDSSVTSVVVGKFHDFFIYFLNPSLRESNQKLNAPTNYPVQF